MIQQRARVAAPAGSECELDRRRGDRSVRERRRLLEHRECVAQPAVGPISDRRERFDEPCVLLADTPDRSGPHLEALLEILRWHLVDPVAEE